MVGICCQRIDKGGNIRRFNRALFVSWTLILAGVAGAACAQDPVKKRLPVDDSTFRCVSEMTKVRHFYVDNLLGNLEGTAAESEGEKVDSLNPE